MPERGKDLEVAQEMARRGFFEWACFAAQQSAEKALKAVFQKMHAVAWGHSVFELLRVLSERIQVDEELFGYARTLDDANGFPEGSPMEYFTEGEAHHALLCAQGILRFCERFLSGG